VLFAISIGSEKLDNAGVFEKFKGCKIPKFILPLVVPAVIGLETFSDKL